MENSAAASDSNTVVVENGSDPPDVPPTSVLTENIVEGGDVSKEIKKVEKENRSIDEMKAEEEEKVGIEDLKEGVDKSVENNDMGDKMDSRNKENEGEKDDSGELKDLKGTEEGEEIKEVGQTKEPKEKEGIGETMHLEEQKDEKEAIDGQEKKDGWETKEIEGKEDVRETMNLERQKDTNESKEGEENKDGEEEKGFGETKDEEGKKAAEEIKHGDEGSDAKGAVNATKNMKETSDIKGTRQKEVAEEGGAYKDDNSVELLKDLENKQGVQGINNDEQKSDLGDENNVGNVSKRVKDKGVRAKKKPKEILMVKPHNVKKKVAVDDKENVIGSGSEEGGDADIEDDDISEEENDDGDVEKKSGRKKVATSSKKKRVREEKIKNKGEVKGKLEAKEKKESGEKPKESLNIPIDTSPSSPVITSRERPVRERKIVERLVEVIEKEPNKTVIIEKGRGTPLKDIPNVAYKIARKKPVDLKFLHQTLFGRRGKLVDFKSHILQFSGFAWHETEEKQRARLKEKLDKCVKDDLLDICDLLDLSVSRASTKKEEIIVKLVDFLEAPHATTDVILAEEQSEKSRKRKRLAGGSASRRSGGTAAKKSRTRKRTAKDEGRPKSKGKSILETKDEDEEEDAENGVPDEEDAPRHSESDAKENESSEASDGDDKNEDDDVDYEKGKQEMVQSPEKQTPAIRERRTGSNSKKFSSQIEVRSLAKTAASSNKQLKVKKDDTGEKVFSRRTKKESEAPEASDDEGGSEDVDHLEKRKQDIKQSPQQQGSSVSKKRKRMESNSKKASSQTAVKISVKTPSSKQSKIEKDDSGEKVFTRKKKDADSPKKSSSKLAVKGKKSGKGKAASEGPSKSDLRKTICETLKDVDFNTATFTDIFKRLATHYKMDLTPKKAAIKQMIQEELTKLADEAEDSEEEDDGETEEDTGKEENPKPAAKKVKA